VRSSVRLEVAEATPRDGVVFAAVRRRKNVEAAGSERDPRGSHPSQEYAEAGREGPVPCTSPRSRKKAGRYKRRRRLKLQNFLVRARGSIL